jgi:hypothetical protein
MIVTPPYCRVNKYRRSGGLARHCRTSCGVSSLHARRSGHPRDALATHGGVLPRVIGQWSRPSKSPRTTTQWRVGDSPRPIRRREDAAAADVQLSPGVPLPGLGGHRFRPKNDIVGREPLKASAGMCYSGCAGPHSSVDRAPASGAGCGRSSRPGGTPRRAVNACGPTQGREG